MATLPPPWPVVPLAAKKPALLPVPGPVPSANLRRTPPTSRFRNARRADPRLTARPAWSGQDDGQDEWRQRTAAYAARVRRDAPDPRPRASVAATAGAALARDLIARTRRERAGVG
jgi:hypothetical protein